MRRAITLILLLLFSLILYICVALERREALYRVENRDSDELAKIYDDSQFTNPILKSGRNFTSAGAYSRFVRSISDKTVHNFVLEYNTKGVNFLSQENKRKFLSCDPEIRSGKPLRAFNRTCTEMRFQRDAGKRVALASFPGSGSTWSRTLLEQATGVYTGAIYCDRSLKGEGFLGEYITSGNVIAVKTHTSDRTQTHYSSTIFIVRNIADAIKSEINRKTSNKNHTGMIDEEELRENFKIVTRYISRLSVRYIKTINTWLNDTAKRIPTIVIRYEDMINDTRTQLRRMLNFLQYPYTEERLDCVMNHQIQTFHRKHDHEFNPFTDDQLRKFLSVMKHVEPLFNLYNISYRDIIDAHA